MIKIEYSENQFIFNKEIFEIVAKVVSDTEKIANTEIDLRITNNKEIQKHNAAYNDADKPTDVLAFRDVEIMSEWHSPEEDNFLGEIIISVEKIKEQAPDNSKTEIEEMVYVFIHGILHLLGYDHRESDEAKIMFEKNDILYQESIKLIKKKYSTDEVIKTKK